MTDATTFEAQYRAVREGVALAKLHHVFALRVTGRGAAAALEQLTPGDLRMREGRLRQSLLLDEAGHPITDVHVCRDTDDWLLLVEAAEAVDADAVVDRVKAVAGSNAIDLRKSHELLLMTGPWSWQLLSEIVGAEVSSLPAGAFFHFEDWIGLRAGKTGEFAYVLLVPSESATSLRARIESIGPHFDLCRVDLDVLDLCALEVNQLNLRREGRFGASPIELQLQWRMQREREFIGSRALAAELHAGPKRQLTAITASDAIAIGDPVIHHGEPIGLVVNAGRSPARGEWIGKALLPTELAHPGIDCFTVLHKGREQPIRTITPPFIQPRSLFVQPNTQRYEHRERYQFPPRS